MDYADRGKLGIVYGDVTLGVHGEDFHLIFSYQTGGLESMVKHGKEWLYRTPKPTFWRATTDNDRGNGFPFVDDCRYVPEMCGYPGTDRRNQDRKTERTGK